MTKGTLPPQAYTREMLTQAFQWVQTQPEGIRKLADSADALVGLYLRAKRSGDANLENSAPVSTENFRKSLKSLATELEQFSNTSTAPVMPSIPNQFVLDIPDSVINSESKSGPSNLLHKTSVKSDLTFIEKPPAQTEAFEARNGQLHKDSNNFNQLDPKTQSILVKVQNRFNLSSENEALRMLVSLGYEHLEKL